MSKFQYAPGLPGYGTQGADGSDGSQGLGIYFSDLDGGSQSSAIRTRIQNNLTLSGTGVDLPGSRIYQNGDVFIDINGLVYVIDDSFNRYSSTGERLNTDTIFVEGEDTSTSVLYKRYYNSYLTTDKFVVDNVYSSIGISNYFQNPNEANGIYSIPGLNFSQINYVDLSVGDYLPFTLWSSNVDTTAPEDTIALVKNYTNNTWRWGNLTSLGAVRDVSLMLDFSNIEFKGRITADSCIYTTGIYNINTEDLFVLTQDVSEGVNSKGLVLKTGNSKDLAGSGSGGDSGDIFIQNGEPGESLNSGGDAGGIFLIAGSGANGGGGTAGKAGDVSIYAGNGGGAFNGQDGGSIEVKAGDAGNSSSAKNGGNVIINAGYNSSATLQDGDVIIQDGGGNTVFGGDIRIPSGTAPSPSFSFSSDTNTGIYNSASNEISFSIDGAQTLIFKERITGNSEILGTKSDGIWISTNNFSIGAPIYIIGGSADGANQNGGDIFITGGDGDDGSSSSNRGGNVYVRGGSDEDVYQGGSVFIEAGDGDSVGGDVTIETTNAAGADGFLFINGPAATTSTTNMEYLMRQSTDGKIFRDTGTPSDERLKNIQGKLTNTLQKISSLNSFYFKWNDLCLNEVVLGDKDKTFIGLSAQETEKVYPEVVEEFIGNDGNQYKKINYEKMVPILVSSINEMKEIIEKQQQQINKLLELNNLK